MHHISDIDRKALTQELKQRPEVLLLPLPGYKKYLFNCNSSHIYLKMTGAITSCC